MTDLLDPTEGVRRHHLKRGEPINEQFAGYVQSSAFSLSLGRTHLRALSHIATGDPMWTHQSKSLNMPAMHGLERRGLVTHSKYEGEPPPFAADAVVWELTTAGKLVVLLLVEAGLFEPGRLSEFPPPPPGWLDPRPKLRFNSSGGLDRLPSDREMAMRGDPS